MSHRYTISRRRFWPLNLSARDVGKACSPPRVHSVVQSSKGRYVADRWKRSPAFRWMIWHFALCHLAQGVERNVGYDATDRVSRRAATATHDDARRSRSRFLMRPATDWTSDGGGLRGAGPGRSDRLVGHNPAPAAKGRQHYPSSGSVFFLNKNHMPCGLYT